MNLISLFVMSVLTQNIVLSKFLGLCPFMGASNKEKKALGMGAAVSIVVILSSIITYLLYYFILVPSQVTYLKTIVFILVIASMVQIMELLLKHFLPKLHQALGIYLPLITTNCAVLGVMLLSINQNYHFLEMLVYSLGSSLGFTLVIYIFSTIQEYMEKKPIPAPFKGYPIAFITAAIMSLLFGRFVIL